MTKEEELLKKFVSPEFVTYSGARSLFNSHEEVLKAVEGMEWPEPLMPQEVWAGACTCQDHTSGL